MTLVGGIVFPLGEARHLADAWRNVESTCFLVSCEPQVIIGGTIPVKLWLVVKFGTADLHWIIAGVDLHVPRVGHSNNWMRTVYKTLHNKAE